MNATPHRLLSFAAALLVTLATLSAVDRLATPEASASGLARADVMVSG